MIVLVLGCVVEPWLHSGYRPLGLADLVGAVALVPLAAGAAILLGRRPRTALGPLLGPIAILFAVGRAADAAVASDVSHGGSQFAGWRVNLTALAMLPAATLAMTFGTLLLPDGHLPPAVACRGVGVRCGDNRVRRRRDPTLARPDQ